MAKEKHQALTPKQELFCQEYIIDFNGTRSAIAAGYSEKTAKQIAIDNLSKLYLQEYINNLINKRVDKLEITQEQVLKDLHYARQVAAGIEPHKIIVKDNIGNGMTQHVEQNLHKTDLAAFVKLTELQMKHLGMFTDKVEHSGTIDINGITDRLIGK